jgi:hypothetical protein
VLVLIPRGKDLVRVRNMGELCAGMAIVLKPCKRHGRTCCEILLRPRTGGGTCEACMGRSAAWETTAEDVPGYRGSCFCLALSDGRLWRLKPDSDADDYEVKRSKPKKVRA